MYIYAYLCMLFAASHPRIQLWLFRNRNVSPAAATYSTGDDDSPPSSSSSTSSSSSKKKKKKKKQAAVQAAQVTPTVGGGLRHAFIEYVGPRVGSSMASWVKVTSTILTHVAPPQVTRQLCVCFFSLCFFVVLC
jgi:hypothetical protein